jgi:hypothetical protein
MDENQKREKLAKFDAESFPDYVNNFLDGIEQSESEQKRCDYFIAALPDEPGK